MSKPIGAYQLGEAYAQSMGVNIKAFRVILILLSSILSACVTAFAGPISFVGIAVPYPGEAWAEHIPTACRHPGDISWRGGILYAL